MKARRVVAAAVAAILVAVGLSSCKDPHAGEHCVAHDTVLMPIFHPGTKYSAGYTTYLPMRSCSQWAPNDPSTVKP